MLQWFIKFSEFADITEFLIHLGKIHCKVNLENLENHIVDFNMI